jgi:ketosteroid isomerase-like protein
MANLDGPNGFTPVRHLTGGTIRMEEMAIATDTADAIFSGDVVMALPTGFIKVGTATAGLAAIGIFAGCKYTAESGEIVYSKYWPAAQATKGDADAVAYVYSDPSIVFQAQCSGTAAFADNGDLIDLEATAGSSSTGRSAQEVNEDASSVLQFRQLGLYKVAGNDWGANGRIEVVFHKHQYLNAAGIAI